jgi:hypothetical protein
MVVVDPEEPMFRFAGKILKLAICVPLLGIGLYASGKYASDHNLQMPFGLANLFEGTTVLRVTDIQRSGDHYICVTYRVTDGNRLYIEDKQGLDVQGLRSIGESKRIDLDVNTIETIKDMSLLVTPVKTGDNDHLMEIRRNNDEPFQVAPNKHAAAAILLRTFERYAR